MQIRMGSDGAEVAQEVVRRAAPQCYFLFEVDEKNITVEDERKGNY